MSFTYTRVGAGAAVGLLVLTLGSVPAAAGQAPRATTRATTVDGSNCRTPVDLRQTQPPAGNAVINRFDVGNHESGEAIRYDRVVIGLDGPAADYRVRYVPQLVHDATGEPVPLRGDADMEVILDSAVTHDDSGNPTVAVRNYLRDWGSLRQAMVVSDFEGVTVVGIGLRQRADFRVLTLTGPHRLVIDVAMPGEHPFTCDSGAVDVFFLNEPRFVGNTEPFFTPVRRRVATPAVAGGALNSLFHGPLGTEFDSGLRLLNSDATGFANLRVQDGIAHVRLTGGCDAGGSTVSIAGSVVPTLKQFPNVEFVKIYDPAGQTADPTGRTDSVPDCLNP